MRNTTIIESDIVRYSYLSQ